MEKREHNIAEWTIALAWLIFILVVATLCAGAQEQYIRSCQQQYACQLGTGISWSAPVQTFVFTPIAPNVSLRIWIHNNNSTSAHTAQTLTLWITNSTVANVSLINQSDVWTQAAITDNTVAGAKCLNVNAKGTSPGASGTGTCYSIGLYAAQVAIQFTPGGALAGASDTFDIGVVQQVSNLVGGLQPGSDPSTAATFKPELTTIANFTGGLSSSSCVNLNGVKSLGFVDVGTSTDGYTFTFVGADGTKTSPALLINQTSASTLFARNALISVSIPPGAIKFCITSAGGGVGGDAFSIWTSPVELTSWIPFVSAGNLTSGLNNVATMTEKGPRWSVSATATGAAVTATKAGIASTRHVADCVAFSMFALVAPAAASADSFQILDGATVIWRWDAVETAAINNGPQFGLCGLNLIGTAGATMSCTGTNATANAGHSCSLSGYDVQ